MDLLGTPAHGAGFPSAGVSGGLLARGPPTPPRHPIRSKRKRTMRILSRARRPMMLAIAGGAAVALGVAPALAANAGTTPTATASTATPIKHLVVLFDENVSFDHYFGTYPKAANTDGTPFTAAPNTPKADTLLSSGTLTNNPNLYDPSRLSPSQAVTCDQDHAYTDEQKAVDDGRMDKFVQYTSKDSCAAPQYGAPGLVMDYYDGNTVSALWNYAQNYSMSDNSWDTTFGPSTPGALNLVSGQTHGAVAKNPSTSATL